MFDDGYWVKFDVEMIEISSGRPHGIRYSLTLHDAENERLIGFDNAHRVKPKRKKYSCTVMTFDHKHIKRSVTQYEFDSPSKLLEDFWETVNNYLSNIRRAKR